MVLTIDEIMEVLINVFNDFMYLFQVQCQTSAIYFQIA